MRLSEWVEVEVCRDEQVYFMEFRKGKRQTQLKKIGQRKKSGTQVTFMPDPEIFPDRKLRYEVLATRLRELAYLNEGLKIKLIDLSEEKEDVFQFDKGLLTFVSHLNEGKKLAAPPRHNPETGRKFLAHAGPGLPI